MNETEQKLYAVLRFGNAEKSSPLLFEYFWCLAAELKERKNFFLHVAFVSSKWLPRPLLMEALEDSNPAIAASAWDNLRRRKDVDIPRKTIDDAVERALSGDEFCWMLRVALVPWVTDEAILRKFLRKKEFCTTTAICNHPNEHVRNVTDEHQTPT